MDEEEYWPVALHLGHCNWLGDDRSPLPAERSVLWVPDSEQRRGWREYVIRALVEDPLPARGIGFLP